MNQNQIAFSVLPVSDRLFVHLLDSFGEGSRITRVPFPEGFHRFIQTVIRVTGNELPSSSRYLEKVFSETDLLIDSARRGDTRSTPMSELLDLYKVPYSVDQKLRLCVHPKSRTDVLVRIGITEKGWYKITIFSNSEALRWNEGLVTLDLLTMVWCEKLGKN
jgi:hypothetical protein